nr:hypothetical protein [Paludisphaera soli]
MIAVNAVGLLRLDGDRAAPGHFQVEPHHRLVDRADLLDVERPVAQPLAVEDEQVLEHAEDDAVGDVRRGDRLAGPPLRAPGPPLQERVAVRVEQVALPRQELQPAVPAAVVDQAEERQELRPRAVAVVHRVGVPAGILAEPLEEAGDRIELLVDLVAGDEPAILGVEHEDEPHQHGEQSRVDVVRVVLQHGPEQFALRPLVGRLEPPDEFIEGLEHLLGELGGDEVLVLAAVRQDRGEALLGPEREEPLLAKQHVQGREDRPPGDLGHVLDAESRVARSLAARGVDQAELRAVGEQPDGDLRLAQQPFEPRLAARLPAVVVRLADLVEPGPGGEGLDEHHPGAIAVRAGLVLAERVGGPERLVVLGQGDFERIGEGAALGRADEILGPPAQHFRAEPRQVQDGRRRVVLPGEVDFGDAIEEAGVVGDDVPVRERLRRREGGGRDHEAHRLHVAEPFLVALEFGVDRHRSSCYPVTGQI